MTDLSKIEELQQLLNLDSEDASVSLLEDSDWDIQVRRRRCPAHLSYRRRWQ